MRWRFWRCPPPEPLGDVGQDLAVTGADYVSALYHDRVEWYHDILTRAQVLLTIEGVFAGFLSASLFGKAGDVSGILSHFGKDTWAFLMAMGFSLAASLWLTARVLIPRVDRLALRTSITTQPQDGRYRPDVMWWFRHIDGLDRARFIREAVNAPPELLTRALAANVHSLGHHLAFKYKRLSVAFFFTGVTFISFLATGASYLWHIAR